MRFLSTLAYLTVIRRSSVVEADPQNVIASMENSTWGGEYFVPIIEFTMLTFAV